MPGSPRVETLLLFSGLHERLLELLQALSSPDWCKPTACPGWDVQDIAAHILDTQLRLVSAGRDGHFLPPPTEPIQSYKELVQFLNGLNRKWVEAMRRVSPRILVRLLADSGPALVAYLETLDPEGESPFPVSWAGETVSRNWFDIGRHYTEYWHHQQQIRDATGTPSLIERRWLHPVLSLFVRAVPVAYATVEAPTGSAVRITIEGEAGGTWTLVRVEAGWELSEGQSTEVPDASVYLSDDTAWRLFTNGLDRGRAENLVRLEGNRTLAERFLSVRSVMV